MRQTVLISLGVIFVIGLLAVINAVTYVQKEKMPDREAAPNRSTYNSGATGTQAFYTLLAETGHTIARWPEPATALLTARNKPSVFVIIGTQRREFKKAEISALLDWVAGGGRLVIIDRDPEKALVQTSSEWNIAIDSVEAVELYSTDPSDPAAMTSGRAVMKPIQPGIFSRGVTAVQPSRFAGAIKYERRSADAQDFADDRYLTQTFVAPSDSAPNTHFGSDSDGLVAEAVYGSGRIVFLADPYIISNGGIALADNAPLGVNLVKTDGLIVFDEYHQGYGSDSNRLLAFFAGTPVIAIFFQAMLLVGLILYSQSRRFGRPIPEAEPDRLSKLEYIAAMAELQQRTRAYDLAIENIYVAFCRRLSSGLGLNESTSKPEAMARAICERLGGDAFELSSMFLRCEDIIRGDVTNKREAVEIAVKLRDIESKLGLGRVHRQRL